MHLSRRELAIERTSPSRRVAIWGASRSCTTNQATLTVSVTGTLDVTTGEFRASGLVTAATGRLAGASGSLSLSVDLAP